MKKLVVKSENEEEDREAVRIIRSRSEDIDDVVWYSHLGKRLARIEEFSTRLDTLDSRVATNLEDSHRTRASLCNLDRFVGELDARITTAEEKLVLLEAAKK